MKHKNLQNLTLSALFVAVGLVLPMLTGQIRQIGNMLLPMHLPVLLCGLICGWPYGLVVGAVLPLMRSLIFGMPPLFPTATAMAFELATYGLVIGLLYHHARRHNLFSLYGSLMGAMAAGRIVWGAAMTVLLGMSGKAFAWSMFWAGALLNAIPGIVLQLVLIPALMLALDRTKLTPFSRSQD